MNSTQLTEKEIMRMFYAVCESPETKRTGSFPSRLTWHVNEDSHPRQGGKFFLTKCQEKTFLCLHQTQVFCQELKWTPEPFCITTTINRHCGEIDSKKTSAFGHSNLPSLLRRCSWELCVERMCVYHLTQRFHRQLSTRRKSGDRQVCIGYTRGRL